MWYYVLGGGLGAVLVAWAGFVVGVEAGESRGWFKGYDKGRLDAKTQMVELLDRHHAPIHKEKDEQNQKEPPPESPKTPESPLFPILPQP